MIRENTLPLSTRFLAALLLLGLMVLSQVYWMERVFFADAAYQVYAVLVTGEFAIQVQRFGAAVVQSFPLLARELGLDLEMSLRAYSLAFALYPLVLFGLLCWPLRQYRMALALSLYYGLQQVHSFYWIQNELVQANVYALFALGMTAAWLPRWRWGYLVPLAFMWVLVIYAHPLGVYGLLLGGAYVALYYGHTYWRQYASLVGLTFLVLVYKHLLSQTGAYDQQAMGLFAGFGKRLPDFFSLASTQFFGARLISTYYLLVLASLVVSTYYVWRREWWRLAWILVSCLGWLLLILVTYHWTPVVHYVESYYMTLGLLLALPLAHEILPSLPKKWMLPTLLGLLCILRWGQIVDTQDTYIRRLDWLQTQVERMRSHPEARHLMDGNSIPDYLLLHYKWAVSYETLMLSSLDNKPARTLFLWEAKHEPDSLAHLSGAFATPFDYLDTYDVLEKSPYFRLRDTLPARILPVEW